MGGALLCRAPLAARFDTQVCCSAQHCSRGDRSIAAAELQRTGADWRDGVRAVRAARTGTYFTHRPSLHANALYARQWRYARLHWLAKGAVGRLIMNIHGSVYA